MAPLDQTLREFGADPEAVLRFDDDRPELLPYATLVAARGTTERGMTGAHLRALYGVYEWQGSPLIFLVDAAELGGDEEHLRRIRRTVAMRGDAPYIGVVSPGQLRVYTVALDAKQPAQVTVEAESNAREATVPRLANLRPSLPATSRHLISAVILKLLSSAINGLKANGRNAENTVSDEDAVSLVGRALFTRFLADRALLAGAAGLSGRDASTLFDDAASAAATSAWLDETFNGDFLPLSDGIFAKLGRDAYGVLGNVLRRAPGGQLFLGWRESWDSLDFAHIPVGVLSQAYEHYLREHAAKKQKKEGGFYTPTPIAELMVNGALHASRRDGRDNGGPVRILDPAAGAGVFLLTAFRRLVAERWRRDGVRPDTRTLRDVLYNQLVGFDINEAALRFAALGLYLISIELDPHPEPVQKLAFRNLRGHVLHKVGTDEGTDARRLGSLGPDVGPEHAGRYDIVIGNPPWASATKLPNWDTVARKVADIARDRLPPGSRPPPLPNEALDLPFIWRAMEWAKPGGQIAFALHARLLFQQSDGMQEARRALFSALDVVGVVNGADLRQTRVWPKVLAPFCLLYARNQVPGPGAGFRFVSPRLEEGLNNAGQMRIDADDGVTVTPGDIASQPDILKVLFRGGEADLAIYQGIQSRNYPTLKALWGRAAPWDVSRPFGRCGSGYQRLRDSSPLVAGGEKLRGQSADFLTNLANFDMEAASGLLADTKSLPKFADERVHRRRERNLYRAPLLLVHQSPPASQGRIRVVVALQDVAFSETYYGYSAAGHPDGDLVVKYLGLLLSSRTALWLALITSGKFGFERDVVEKSTIDNIPIPGLNQPGALNKDRITDLFDGVARGAASESWKAVDDWAAEVYGLGEEDLRVIRDTLEYNLPFAKNRARAQSPPDHASVARFCKVLADELLPWGQRFDMHVDVQPDGSSPLSPWRSVRILRGGSAERDAGRDESSAWPGLLHLANQLAATEVTLPAEDGSCLLLGRLNQSRHWTETQARRAAQRVIWHNIDFLSGQRS